MFAKVEDKIEKLDAEEENRKFNINNAIAGFVKVHTNFRMLADAGLKKADPTNLADWKIVSNLFTEAANIVENVMKRSAVLILGCQPKEVSIWRRAASTVFKHKKKEGVNVDEQTIECSIDKKLCAAPDKNSDEKTKAIFEKTKTIFDRYKDKTITLNLAEIMPTKVMQDKVFLAKSKCEIAAVFLDTRDTTQTELKNGFATQNGRNMRELDATKNAGVQIEQTPIKMTQETVTREMITQDLIKNEIITRFRKLFPDQKDLTTLYLLAMDDKVKVAKKMLAERE